MIEKIIKGIKYLLDEETMTAEVIAKRNGCEGDIIIPETVVLKKVSYIVTSIGKNAFFSCKSLQSITIPDSVKVIADMVFFRCEMLTEITIPNSIKSIGYGTFENCVSLKTITYNGIRAKWGKITLADKWYSGIPAKFVHCTDGYAKI